MEEPLLLECGFEEYYHKIILKAFNLTEEDLK